MEVTGMNHFTVLTKNLASSVQFYAQTLWLSKGPRPELSFPGAWLYCNGGPIVHLISSDTSAPPFGVIDHMAFMCTGPARASTAPSNGPGFF